MVTGWEGWGESGEKGTRRLEGVMLLALKMGGAASQGRQPPLGAGKGWGWILPWSLQKGTRCGTARTWTQTSRTEDNTPVIL